MAFWESITVRQAVSQMHNEQMVLPVIQRNLVWNEDKMELLFDSLFCRNSFGSIICVEEERDAVPLFAHRLFSAHRAFGDDDNIKSHREDRVTQSRLLVIDGQQRLQSFYIGLCGTYDGKTLYFDLFSSPGPYEYNYNFQFSSSERGLFRINKNSVFGEYLWCSVPYIFSQLKKVEEPYILADQITGEKGITERDKANCIERNISLFYRRVFSDSAIGLSKVIAHMSKDIRDDRLRIAEMFQRLNTSGMSLSSYELFISGLSVFNDDIKSFLHKLIDENGKIIDMDVLLKMIMVLNDHPSKNITDISSMDGAREDAEFTTNNMERIRATLEALQKFLKASNNEDWFDSVVTKSSIPLYFLAYHIFWHSDKPDEIRNMFNNFDTNNKDFRNMVLWLRLSILNQVFKKGCGWDPNKTGMKKIHEVMRQNKGKIFPVNELFDVYKKHPLHNFFDKDTLEPQALDKLDQEYLFYMIYGGRRSTVRIEDKDHIHPRSLLTKKNVSSLKINSIGNLQYIDYGTNRGNKSSLELRDWISGIEDKKGYLSRHLIPENEALWTSDKFTSFLNERLRLIARKIKSML